jgi:hypothetical protein
MRKRNYSIDIPLYWSPEQVEAVYDFLGHIVDAIAIDYADVLCPNGNIEPSATGLEQEEIF